MTARALLSAAGLDVVYEHALGAWLGFRGESGELVRVLDLAGAQGATLCGHQHPALVAIARACLAGAWPFAAPASVPGAAARLAERLEERLARSSGRAYVATLAATANEAVEAAIKHAELEASARLAARRQAAEDGVRRARRAVRDGARVPAELPGAVAKLLGLLRPPAESELWTVLRRAVADATARPPLFLAALGGHHGETTGAMALGSGVGPWQRIGLRVRFLPRGDEAALEAALRAEQILYPSVDVDEAGAIRILPARFVNVVAAFVEPILGEGGVHELSPVYLSALRQAADQHGFPLVLDERECGLGRTGRFLASEAARVRGDYVVLGRALGGGLGERGALLVEKERWRADFAALHTGGADDELGGAIGLGVLDLVDGEEAGVARLCHGKGERLLTRLRALRARFPDELVAVRGRGLMIGAELGVGGTPADGWLGVLAEQRLLGWMAAGWLLREARVRVLPAAGAPMTLRVEPSAFVAEEDLDAFVTAFERLLQILHEGRVAALVGEDAAAIAVAVAPPANASVALLVPFHATRLAPVLSPFDLPALHVADTTVRRIAVPGDRWRAALERARSGGATVVGFADAAAAEDLVDDELTLVTSTALAAAARLEAALAASSAATVIVRDAGSAAGAILAEVAADRCARLVLDGGSDEVAAAVYESALRRLARGGEAATSGLARALAELPAASELIGPQTRTPRPVLTGTGARLHEALAGRADAPVVLAQDVALGEGETELSPSGPVQVFVPDGGEVDVALAATLLAARERGRDVPAPGVLRADDVRRAAELARRHGFRFGA